MLVIVIAVALAAYLLAYLTSQSTLKRISQLTGTMQAVEKGNVTVRLEPSGNDEIAQMMDGFNQMMDRVDTLMEERVEYGRQIKNLELKALQAQINPHFLYNSLDLINCTAINNNGEGTGKPNFSCYRCTDPGCDFDNLMSYYDASIFLSDAKLKGGASNDKYVGTYNNGVYYNSGYYLVESDTAITNGAKIGTKFAGPTASDFIALTKAPEQGTDFHKVWRNADGSLNLGGLYETKTDGAYGTMGYHLSNSDTPIVTTTTTTGQNPTTTTTTTTVKPTTTTSGKQSETPTPSGAQIHDFTANGKNSSFYTITGNLATNKGTVSYNGLTLTQSLKMESATSIGFTNTAKGDLTLVFVEPNATVKVDGTKYTANGDGIIQVSVSAGTHTITKADTANLYYMVYADQGGTVVTTTTTATATTTTTTTTINEEGLNYGDVNLDGVVDLADCITVNKYLADVIVLSDIAQKNADVDRDNNVGDKDVSYLMKFVLNSDEVPDLPVDTSKQ